MDFESTLGVIKSKGYWFMNFYPTSKIEAPLVSTGKAKEIIRAASVHLRGWDYPHVPSREREHANLVTRGSAIESWIDWQDHKEVWRLALNGQFVHLFSVREDWYRDVGWGPSVEPNTVIDVISVIYTCTEIFSFMKNLASSEFGTDESRVEVGLRNMKNRKLAVLSPDRMPLWQDYVCYSDEIQSLKLITGREELQVRFLEWAVELVAYIFGQFNWDSPPMEMIWGEARKLAEGKVLL